MVSQRSQQLALEQQRHLNTHITATNQTLRLQAHSVRFSWGDRLALNNISLDLHAGEMFGLLGPNGAGKTTLISLIAGLIKPDQGELSVLGHSTHKAADLARKNLGFVFQSVSLDRFMTVEENLFFAAGLQGLDKAQTRSNLAHLFTVFPIEGWLKRTVGSLSGGQKRLVDIARALIHRPGVLILDEPTNNLDPASVDAVGRMFRHWEGTVVVVSHEPAFVEALAPTHCLRLPDERFDFWREEDIDVVSMR